MKRLLYLTICALLAVGFSSCSKDNPKNYQKLILGTWTPASFTYYMNDDIVKTGSIDETAKNNFGTYTFREDGTCITSKSSMVTEYSIKGEYLYISGAGFPVSFEGNKMFLTHEYSTALTQLGGTPEEDVKYNKMVLEFVKVR